MIDDATLRALLTKTLASTDFAIPRARRYVGKVRDNYTVDGKRLLVVTDRISAFDVVLGTIPLKGQVLNRMAAHWFEATRAIVANHLVGVPDPNAMEAIDCAPIPVEMVMRAYLTGVTSTSIWQHYQKGERVFCGHRLPDGMRKNEPLPQPILTPSTKAEKGGHDVSLARDAILAQGALDAATFDEAAAAAAKLFAFGQARARERGLILVDTKYEFGRAPDGRLLVIDEIHTPDSSRYWFAEDYERRLAAGEEPRALDKEYVRRWYAARGYTGDGPPPPLDDEVRVEAAKRYIEAYERVSGESFVADLEDPIPRLARNLGIAR